MHATTRQRKLFFVLGALAIAIAVGFAAFTTFAFNPLTADACCSSYETHSDNDTAPNNPPPQNNPPPNPPQVYGPECIQFMAEPSTIKKGQSATLSWYTINAQSVTLSGFGSVPAIGEKVVSPTQTTTYTLTVVGNSNSGQKTITCKATVTVKAKEICPKDDYDIYGREQDSQMPTGYGSSYGGDKCPPKDVCPNLPGNQSTVPYGYELKYGKCVPKHEEKPLSCDLDVSKAEIKKGESVRLSWTSRGADAGFIDEGVGSVGPSGSKVVYPTVTTTYVGTFWNDEKDVTCEVTVKVKNKSYEHEYEQDYSSYDQYNSNSFDQMTDTQSPGGYQGRR